MMGRYPAAVNRRTVAGDSVRRSAVSASVRNALGVTIDVRAQDKAIRSNRRGGGCRNCRWVRTRAA